MSLKLGGWQRPLNTARNPLVIAVHFSVKSLAKAGLIGISLPIFFRKIAPMKVRAVMKYFSSMDLRRSNARNIGNEKRKWLNALSFSTRRYSEKFEERY
jgi:hypothetical protein